MDWLRSEDLKEEKVVTTPFAIVSVLIVENNVEKNCEPVIHPQRDNQ